MYIDRVVFVSCFVSCLFVSIGLFQMDHAI